MKNLKAYQSRPDRYLQRLVDMKQELSDDIWNVAQHHLDNDATRPGTSPFTVDHNIGADPCLNIEQYNVWATDSDQVTRVGMGFVYIQDSEGYTSEYPLDELDERTLIKILGTITA